MSTSDFTTHVTRITGLAPEDLAPDAILAICVGRNEGPQIPWFLDYYRELGVDHFLYIDNASDDDSRDLLTTAEDVTLFHTDQGYLDAHNGRHWSMKVARDYAVGHWTLTLDLDEVLVYPMIEQVGLRAFTDWMGAQKAEAMLTLMVDMYPSAPEVYAPGRSFIEASPFFDTGPYWMSYTQSFPHLSFFGGARHRLLFDGDAGTGPVTRAGAPVLRKVPLVKWRKDTTYLASTHKLNKHALCDVTGAILHFKFLKDFHAYAQDEVARGQRNPGEYEDYLRLSPDEFWARLHGAHSTRYDGSAQLIKMGLMHASRDDLAEIFRAARQGLSKDEASALWQTFKTAKQDHNRAFQMQLGHFFADLDAQGGKPLP